MAKQVTDRWLDKLFRDAVLAKFKGRCVFCGNRTAPLEVHHHVKRRDRMLRWDWRNGVPVCKYPSMISKFKGMSCHQYADTPAGRAEIDRMLDVEYLQERAMITLTQYCLDNGITKNEFRDEMKKELQEIINEGRTQRQYKYRCQLNRHPITDCDTGGSDRDAVSNTELLPEDAK